MLFITMKVSFIKFGYIFNSLRRLYKLLLSLLFTIEKNLCCIITETEKIGEKGVVRINEEGIFQE